MLAQTRGDWELIVVDNGNSDEMARSSSNYTSDPRIKLIRQDNKGYVGGVSAAAAVAEGRYLCVLDSDDAVQPDYCERVGALIDADPGIDAVGCNAMLFSEPDDGQKPGEYFALIGRKAVPDPSRSASFTELLNEGVPPYVGTIRREAWEALGGYESSPDVEPDVALWLRLASTGRDVRILPDKLIQIAHEGRRRCPWIRQISKRSKNGCNSLLAWWPGSTASAKAPLPRPRWYVGCATTARCARPDRHCSPATSRPRVLRPAMRSVNSARCVPPSPSAGCT